MKFDQNENETEGIRYGPEYCRICQIESTVFFSTTFLSRDIPCITACILSSLYTFYPTVQATQDTSTTVGSLANFAYITGSTQQAILHSS